MPTYQYRCTECGRDLEVFQKFSDASLTECPTCSGELRKVFNAVGVVFKGSGFYRTDSRSGADLPKASSSSEKGSSGNGSEKKSETKSDSPSTSKPAEKAPATAGSSSTAKAASS